VKPEDGRVLAGRVISRRKIDIKVARLVQRLGPNSAIRTVIVSIVDHFAGQSAIVPIQADVPELASGLERRRN